MLADGIKISSMSRREPAHVLATHDVVPAPRAAPLPVTSQPAARRNSICRGEDISTGPSCLVRLSARAPTTPVRSQPRGLRAYPEPSPRVPRSDGEPAGGHPRHRVDLGPTLAADAHLEVQVRSGRLAQRADQTDQLPGPHSLADIHQDLLFVAVDGHVAV